ncbi:MAG: MFS transporter [Pseudomonadales bacterium]
MPATRDLSDNGPLRTTVLCLLYFCQGVPWGFATIALLATLSEAGHDKSVTASITAMAILPWTFKFFWAPLIDSVRMPALGVRRPWIVIAQLGMSLTLLTAWSSGALGSEATLVYLAWVLFFHNCFASLQDVATDALALDLLADRERGTVLGFMWASKLLGVTLGGAGLAIVIARTSFEAALAAQALLILAVCGLLIAVRERPGERLLPWSRGAAHIPAVHQEFGLGPTLRNLMTALSTRTTFLLVLVAATAMVCEGLYDPLTTEFFVQKLGWSAEEFATRQGTLGVTGEMIGALTGGYLASRFGGRRFALVGLGMIMAITLTFALTAGAWDEPGYPHLWLLPSFRGSIAFTTVCMFSVYMQACWTLAAATQFTLYMALSNIGYSLGAKLNAWLPALGVSMEYDQYYLLTGLVPALAFTLLLAVGSKEVAPPELEPQTA